MFSWSFNLPSPEAILYLATIQSVSVLFLSSQFYNFLYKSAKLTQCGGKTNPAVLEIVIGAAIGTTGNSL